MKISGGRRKKEDKSRGRAKENQKLKSLLTLV
jgi:hypothetical protein